MAEQSLALNKITRFVGIDAGVNTGLAVFNTGSKSFSYLKTLDFFSCLHQLLIIQKQSIDEGFLFAVVIENPKGNSPTFEHFHKNAARVRDSISQKIGSNKRDAELIKTFCDLHDMTSFMITPSKNSLTKLTAERFKQLTGFEGSSSQHARDAAGLVFGMLPVIPSRTMAKDIAQDIKKKPPAALFLPIT